MLHQNRWFSVSEVNRTDLVRYLLETQDLCTAFAYRPAIGGLLLFVNDSCTEDSLQEYAVVKVLAESAPVVTGQGHELLSGTQVESLTISWFNAHDLESAIQSLVNGEYATHVPVILTVQAADG